MIDGVNRPGRILGCEVQVSIPEPQWSALARLSHLDSSYFCRVFGRRFGIPPIHYLLNTRIRKAKELLEDSELSISEIARRVGFQSLHYFSRYFAKREHMSPNQYRHQAESSFYLDQDLRVRGAPRTAEGLEADVENDGIWMCVI